MLKATNSFLAKEVSVFLYSISLLPLWWILGVDFVVYHLVAIYFLFRLPAIYKPDAPVKVILILMVFILLLSNFISYLFFDFEPFRHFSAINNASVLLVGYCYYSLSDFFLKRGFVRLPDILRAGYYIALVYIALAVFLFYFVVNGTGGEGMRVPTLFGIITPEAPGLLGKYQEAILVSSNWFMGDATPRLFILAPYATGTALVGCICAFWGAAYLHSKNTSSKLRWLFLMCMFIGVILTLSRATVTGYILGIMIVVFASISKRMLGVLLPLILIFIMLSVPYLVELFQVGLESRQGSANTRMFSYLLSIDIVLKENFLTGIGVKPRYEHMLIPVGSHSSFIGLMVRGGGVALIMAFFMFVILPIAKCYSIYVSRLKDSSLDQVPLYLIGCYICCLLFLVFQDIDAYPSLCMLVFVTLAMIFFSAGSIDRTKEADGV